MFSSEVVTEGVRVRVRSFYVPERSEPDQGHWFFAYQVWISNEGSDTVQVVSRHWIITDAEGNVEHVRGPGIVGEQPVLAPGESFQYTSACPLRTPVGTMHGSYRVVRPGGESFEATIAPFGLGQPDIIH